MKEEYERAMKEKSNQNMMSKNGELAVGANSN